MAKNSAMFLVVLLQFLSVINCWQNSIEPRRDKGGLERSISKILSNKKLLVNAVASFAFGKVILGYPRTSLALSQAPDVSTYVLLDRVNSMDSQAFQTGIKLKDVYYPSWWEIILIVDCIKLRCWCIKEIQDLLYWWLICLWICICIAYWLETSNNFDWKVWWCR